MIFASYESQVGSAGRRLDFAALDPQDKAVGILPGQYRLRVMHLVR